MISRLPLTRRQICHICGVPIHAERGVKWEAFVVEADKNHEPENQKTRRRKHCGLMLEG
jgi:hypothetical protein